MEKTLKQIADEYAPAEKSAGLKQKLYRYAAKENLPASRTDDKGTKFYDGDALEKLTAYAAEQGDSQQTAEEKTSSPDLVNFLYDQIAVKDEQIADLTEQNRLLHETVAALTESIKAAQILHAQTITALAPPQKPQGSMNTETPTDTHQTQETAATSPTDERRGILSIFRRKQK
jgi:hypothetical protein